MDIIKIIFIFASLIIACICDIKTKTIPLWLFPILFVLDLVLSLFGENVWYLDKCIGLLIAGITFFVLAYFGGGGGDIIMMAVLGWCIGFTGIIIVSLCSSVICLVYGFVVKGIKKRTSDIPYAPFALAGYTIYLLTTILIF